MDYNKIGNFIASERKLKNLTQAKLAEKIFVSEKTISKWEKGKGLPDTSSLPKLCEVFNVNINELLSGERIPKDNYNIKAEERFLEMQKIKEDKDKTLLFMEIVIGILSTTILLSFNFLAAFVSMEKWLKILLIVLGFVIGLTGLSFALKIEQTAGYYLCKKCNHKHIPTYKQVLCAPHINRTRYMKCPKCKKISWQKKVIK